MHCRNPLTYFLSYWRDGRWTERLPEAGTVVMSDDFWPVQIGAAFGW